MLVNSLVRLRALRTEANRETGKVIPLEVVGTITTTQTYLSAADIAKRSTAAGHPMNIELIATSRLSWGYVTGVKKTELLPQWLETQGGKRQLQGGDDLFEFRVLLCQVADNHSVRLVIRHLIMDSGGCKIYIRPLSHYPKLEGQTGTKKAMLLLPNNGC